MRRESSSFIGVVLGEGHIELGHRPGLHLGQELREIVIAQGLGAAPLLSHLDLAGWLVCKEDPIVLPKGREGRESVPEPDLSVLRGDIEDYDRRKPGPADVGLIVEVADTSVRKDRGMLLRYAHANVPTTWLIDLNTRVVEVHTDPTGPAKRPRYRKVARFADNETVPVVLDGLEVGRVAVRDLLP